MSDISKKENALNETMRGESKVSGKLDAQGSQGHKKTSTPNWKLMEQARESLNGNWGLGVGAMAILFGIGLFFGIVDAATFILGTIAGWLINPSLELGWHILCLSISRHEHAEVSQLFNGFNRFGTALGAALLMGLFIILGFICLIIPGIILAYSYSMTFFIIADDDNIGPYEAMEKSRKMMYGYKWKMWFLGWRFLGWAILCILTLGIGFLWFGPYAGVTAAKFYDDIK